MNMGQTRVAEPAVVEQFSNIDQDGDLFDIVESQPMLLAPGQERTLGRRREEFHETPGCARVGRGLGSPRNAVSVSSHS
jgi:hypothetical protein